MLSALWMIVILTGFAGLLSAFTSRRSEETFAFSICGIIVILYVFALLDAPEWGYRTVQILGSAAFLTAAVLSILRREVRARVLTPGCVVFAIWILIAWWAHRGQVYNTYDEFFHWGTAANRLYMLEMLPSKAEGVLLFPSYPPGSTLFYCFWTWLGGNFSEGNTIAAANVVMVSCLMPMMKHTSWKQWKRMFPMMLVIILLPMVFKHTVYQDLYVDVLLGCLAAYALISWFTGKKDLLGRIIIAVTMAALALVKASGIAIAALALLAIAADGWKGEKQQRRSAWLAIAFALAFAMAASMSWNIFLSRHGIVSEKPFRYWEISANLQYFLSGTAPGYLKSQYVNFFDLITEPRMMGEGNILELNYLEWLLAFALIACWLKRAGKEDDKTKRYSTAVWMMLAITILYTVLLYHTYLYTFEYWEAASLHSFDRYMSSIMTLALCVTAALALETLHHHPPQKLPSVMILLTCLVLLVPPTHLIRLTFTAPQEVAVSQQSRAESVPAVAVSKKLGEGDRIAWLTMDTGLSAFSYLINRYELMPAQMDRPCDYWLEQPCEEVRKALSDSDYSHVYCFYTNEEFVEKYHSLFEKPEEIGSRTLYRVIRKEDDILLQKVI